MRFMRGISRVWRRRGETACSLPIPHVNQVYKKLTNPEVSEGIPRAGDHRRNRYQDAPAFLEFAITTHPDRKTMR